MLPHRGIGTSKFVILKPGPVPPFNFDCDPGSQFKIEDLFAWKWNYTLFDFKVQNARSRTAYILKVPRSPTQDSKSKMKLSIRKAEATASYQSSICMRVHNSQFKVYKARPPELGPLGPRLALMVPKDHHIRWSHDELLDDNKVAMSWNNVFWDMSCVPS